METINVIACFDWLEQEETIGQLKYENLRGGDVYSFEYANDWLQKHPDILLSKDLMPYTGIQYNQTGKGIFGCFADALPDRWGKKLIELRTNQILKSNGQSKRRLSDWDYLKGVEDVLRMGAFRFKDSLSGKFLNTADIYQIPPVLSLNELLEASKEIEKSDSKHEEPEERWIERLFQPGSSVGGARPKACVTDKEILYIAKFPSIKDEINISKWEFFAHQMAKECGINTAQTKLVSTNSEHDILLSKRFDRTNEGKRVHMASSLTLLGLTDGAGAQTGNGYLDIVDFIVTHGSNVEKSLEELYRRVAFNICIGNTDDHFRNHSFLLTKKGWELAPAYDMNPTLNRHQALLIDEQNNESKLDVLYEAHQSYMLDEHTAWGIIKDVTRNMRYWEATALRSGLSRKELNEFAERIENGREWNFSDGLKR